MGPLTHDECILCARLCSCACAFVRACECVYACMHLYVYGGRVIDSNYKCVFILFYFSIGKGGGDGAINLRWILL